MDKPTEDDVDALMQVSMDAAQEAIRKHGLGVQAVASAYMTGFAKGHAKGLDDVRRIDRKVGLA